MNIDETTIKTNIIQVPVRSIDNKAKLLVDLLEWLNLRHIEDTDITDYLTAKSVKEKGTAAIEIILDRIDT